MNSDLARLEGYVRGDVQASPDEVLKMIHETLQEIERRREVSRRAFETNMDRLDRMMKELSHA
ncbi:MAG: hypothetical protein A3F84_17315 [Candidatus Handelsmanbacteria bacterium RIFCSPLOWO2_12_FULL_64_10]|uniref:Uncharacterized protein n=1 Tax=Handelsmanbacteria sp. (strain RIFCSPLOWO2_12_FULL_64_10) TaxID=1817868 RepID=A0A1F6D706_HANXR|nr:MAG: hypothetical protein A3F84_17315 [Candidatus Handelsmanbacteria bacterium RIFCSPLOWO2_12_FULL_64_10]